MSDEVNSAIKRLSCNAIAAALIGWLLYAVKQQWTPQSAIIGVFYDLLHILAAYMLMPFAFSALPPAAADYVKERSKGNRDVAAAGLTVASVVLAVYVVGPVMGDAAVIKITAGFLAFRLIKRYWR